MNHTQCQLHADITCIYTYSLSPVTTPLLSMWLKYGQGQKADEEWQVEVECE